MKSSSTEPCSPLLAAASQDPSEEVTELALEAQNVRTLNPAVAAMLDDQDKRKDFLHHMRRQIQRIQSRSQAFEDAHVTVYDKALLTLTHNGNMLDHPPAIEFYCDEFLGVSNISDQVFATRMLEQSVGVPKLLTQGEQFSSSLSTHHINLQKDTPHHLPIQDPALRPLRPFQIPSAGSQMLPSLPLTSHPTSQGRPLTRSNMLHVYGLCTRMQRLISKLCFLTETTRQLQTVLASCVTPLKTQSSISRQRTSTR